MNTSSKAPSWLSHLSHHHVTGHQVVAAIVILAAAWAWRKLTGRRDPAPAQAPPQGHGGTVLVLTALGVLAVAAWRLGPVHAAIARAAHPKAAPAPRPPAHVTVQHVAASPWPLTGWPLAIAVIVVACCAVALAVNLLRPVVRGSGS